MPPTTPSGSDSATDSADASDDNVDPRVARSRARLLDAATELLVDGGPRAVTVDAVAEESGVAKSTLYRHFPSRTDLLVAVLNHNAPKLGPISTSDDFATALRSLVRSAAATMADPDWARIAPALLSLKNTVPDVRELSEAERSAQLEQLRRLIELGQAEGLVPDGTDPGRTANLLIGPLVMAMLHESLDDIESLADEITDRYLASCHAFAPPSG